MIEDTIYTLVSLILTVSALSFIWKNTDFFAIGCNIAVGCVIANRFFVILPKIQSRTIQPILNGSNMWLIIPLIFGLFAYVARIERYRWLNRYAVSATLGSGIGAMLTGLMRLQIINPIVNTINTVFTAPTALYTFFAIITLIGTITTVGNFIYTRELKGSMKIIPKIGRLFIFFALGTQIAANFSKLLTTLLGTLVPLIRALLPV